MAISKERLQELIEQGATIYVLEGKNVYDIDFEDYEGKIKPATDIYPNDRLIIRWKKAPVGGIGAQWSDEDIYLDDIFETEEDARWDLEMIATRTETLKMPKWEEVCDGCLYYITFIDTKKSN